jgi:hypothetical protein
MNTNSRCTSETAPEAAGDFICGHRLRELDTDQLRVVREVLARFDEDAVLATFYSPLDPTGALKAWLVFVCLDGIAWMRLNLPTFPDPSGLTPIYIAQWMQLMFGPHFVRQAFSGLRARFDSQLNGKG